MRRAGLIRLGRTVYPFLQAELFLPWSEDRFAERIEQTIDMFVREGQGARRSLRGGVTCALRFRRASTPPKNARRRLAAPGRITSLQWPAHAVAGTRSSTPPA
nr:MULTISPECIES: hypothetical protein [Xanthomonas]